MKANTINRIILQCIFLFSARFLSAASGDYFSIEIVDNATGRGVPLVQLETTDKSKFITDSNGLVAFNEPGLMGEEVWFAVSSPGYEFKQESFGKRGIVLKPLAGEKAQLKLRRLNIAERLYRVTGRGIYRDTILLGKNPPIEHGASNGRVMGQDSACTALYNSKLFWFWGDTNRPSHFLGNYFTTGATSELPGKGRLDPSIGINLTYFKDSENGFVKPMTAPKSKGSAPVWIDGLMTTADDSGKDILIAHFTRVNGLVPFESGLLEYNNERNQFEELKMLSLNAKLVPCGQPFRVDVDNDEYYYFPTPYPAIRVKNHFGSATDVALYEGFTCLKDGSAYEKGNSLLDRDKEGKLVWKWRKETSILQPKQIDELIALHMIKRDESPFRLTDADNGTPVQLHHSTVYWNTYRNKWVMIGVQAGGDSYLGEVWYSEANAPEGPWVLAKKIATHAKVHDNQDFYNPIQHPYFAQDGARIIYFEGTYTNTFSGNPNATPNYDYNQLMYRLDLSDPRLKMGEPPAGLSAAKASARGP